VNGEFFFFFRPRAETYESAGTLHIYVHDFSFDCVIDFRIRLLRFTRGRLSE